MRKILVEKNDRILVEIHHGIGDVVQMIPLLRNIKTYRPNCYLAVIVNSKLQQEILKPINLIDKFYFINRNMGLIDIIKVIKEMKNEKFRIGIISPITNKFFGINLLNLIGCSYKIFESKNKILYTHDQIWLCNNKNKHWVERNCLLLNATDIPVKFESPKIPILNDSFMMDYKRDFFDGHSKVVGICLGTGAFTRRKWIFFRQFVYSKQWKVKYFLELIYRLLNFNYKIVLFGGKEEAVRFQEELNIFNNNRLVYNAINLSSLYESCVLAKKCDLVVACDTGMLFIADAVGTKTLGLFGPTNPKMIKPYSALSCVIESKHTCKNCYGSDGSYNLERMFSCKDFACMNDICVDDVEKRIYEIVGERDE